MNEPQHYIIYIDLVNFSEDGRRMVAISEGKQLDQ